MATSLETGTWAAKRRASLIITTTTDSIHVTKVLHLHSNGIKLYPSIRRNCFKDQPGYTSLPAFNLLYSYSSFPFSFYFSNHFIHSFSFFFQSLAYFCLFKTLVGQATFFFHIFARTMETDLSQSGYMDSLIP